MWEILSELFRQTISDERGVSQRTLANIKIYNLFDDSNEAKQMTLKNEHLLSQAVERTLRRSYRAKERATAAAAEAVVEKKQNVV